jgi:hypothetical protein
VCGHVRVDPLNPHHAPTPWCRGLRGVLYTPRLQLSKLLCQHQFLHVVEQLCSVRSAVCLPVTFNTVHTLATLLTLQVMRGLFAHRRVAMTPQLCFVPPSAPQTSCTSNAPVMCVATLCVRPNAICLCVDSHCNIPIVVLRHHCCAKPTASVPSVRSDRRPPALLARCE